MIKVRYSNDLDLLVDGLVANIEQEALQKGLFHSPCILVPNRNISVYLKFGIARRKGIAANLTFRYLDEFLGSVAKQSAKDCIIPDRPMLQGLLVSLLSEAMKEEGYLPEQVKTYITAGGSAPDNTDLRIFQLAGELAGLFEEYELSRPEMLAAWAADRSIIKKPPYNEIELWQKELWRAVFLPDILVPGSRFRPKKRVTGMQDAFRAIDLGPVELPGALHLFGFSYISRVHYEILNRLSEKSVLHLYTVTPCAEFWEDLSTFPEQWKIKKRYISRSEKKGIAVEGDDPYLLLDPADTPALRLWGRPGRENLRLLNELANWDFDFYARDPLKEGPSLLGLLQHDILTREPQAAAPCCALDLAEDASLRILACPGIQREAEVIANEIWDLIIRDNSSRDEKDPGRLRFSDMAVIVADARNAAAYQAHLSSVFEDIYSIPHNITDIRSASGSGIVDILGLLIALPLGDFTREDILKIITHDAVLAGFPEADAEEWLRWSEEACILHGADHESHQETYIKKDVYNWDQGLRRLALGSLMSVTAGDDEETFSVSGSEEKYLPQRCNEDSLENASMLILLVRSLIADARFAASGRLTLSGWADFFMSYATAYITTRGEQDEATFSKCRAAINSLREIDLTGGKVSYVIASEFLLSALSGISSSRGQYLANGVTISSFLPMRPIPFRVVFIAGLGEGCFPSADTRDPLDLRAAGRYAGDVSSRERDQYMFLETLISTREKLILSYVARDGQTGEKLDPSSVIRELLFLLETNYLGSSNISRILTEHPMRRYDERYFPSGRNMDGPAEPELRNYSLSALLEAKAVALRKKATEPERTNAVEAVDWKALPARVSELLKIIRVENRPLRPKKEKVSISFYNLRRFIESALQGWASHQLGLKEEADTYLISRVDEVFSTPFPDDLSVLRDLFVQSLSGTATDLDAACRKRLQSRELRGTSPTGFFHELEYQRFAASLGAWKANFEAAGLSGRGFRRLIFGTPYGMHSSGDLRLRPLLLQLRPPEAVSDLSSISIELTGKTDAVCEDPHGSLILVSASAVSEKHFLRGFLDYLYQVLSGSISEAPYQVTVLSQGKPSAKKSFETKTFGPITKQEAEDYIAGLLSDLIFETHAYLLPLEPVFSYYFQNPRGRNLSEIIAEYLANNTRETASYFGPLRDPENYPVPPDREAHRIIRKRLGLFIDNMKKQAQAAGDSDD